MSWCGLKYGSLYGQLQARSVRLIIILGMTICVCPPIAMAQQKGGGAAGTLAPLPREFGSALANSTLKFYPGEHIIFTVTEQVDANHRYWQERPCDWFGLHCWYEQHNASNYVGPERLPLEMRFVANDKTTPPTPAHNIPVPDPGSGALIAAFQVATRTLDTTIEPDVWSWENARKGYSLLGRLTGRLDHAADATPTYQNTLNRTGCKSPPSEGTCSDGYFRLTVDSIDVSERLDQLAKFLVAAKRDSSTLVSADFMDQSIRVVKPDRAATELWQHVMKRYPTFSDAEKELVLRFALELNESDDTIRNDLTALLINRGDIGQAKEQSEKTLKGAIAKYEAENPHQIETVCTYGFAHTNSAKIWLKDRVGTQPSDIGVAAQMYERAITAYKEVADGDCTDKTFVPAPGQTVPRDTVRTRLLNALVDKARVLGLLRTRQSLLSAAEALEKARDEALKQSGAAGPSNTHGPFEVVSGPAQPPKAAAPDLTAVNIEVPLTFTAIADAAFAQAGDSVSIVGQIAGGATRWTVWGSLGGANGASIEVQSIDPCGVSSVAPRIAVLASGPLAKVAVLLIQTEHSGLYAQIAGSKECSQLSDTSEARFSVSERSDTVVVATPHHPTVFSPGSVERIDLTEYGLDANALKKIRTLELKLPQSMPGVLKTVQVLPGLASAAALFQAGAHSHFLQLTGANNEPQSWLELCDVETTESTAGAGISRDLGTAVWAEARGSIVAIRANSRGKVAQCLEQTVQVSSEGWDAGTVAFAPFGDRGLIAYNPGIGPSAGILKTFDIDFAEMWDSTKTVSRSEFAITPKTLSTTLKPPWRLLGSKTGTVLMLGTANTNLH
jgi:tetratricopeptide (TPR) repeat protein